MSKIKKLQRRFAIHSGTKLGLLESMRGILLLKAMLFLLTALSVSACGNGMKSKTSLDDSSPSANSNAKAMTVGALGDSISRGMDIHFLGLESVDESWSTGSLLSGSIANRAQSFLGS